MQLLEDKDIVESGDMADRLKALRLKVEELLENPPVKEVIKEVITEVQVEAEESEDSRTKDKLVQENLMLQKMLRDREKTIKELDFKLEMFKLAKNLRHGAGIDTKSEELKKIINEYIKEIDKSIATLNIE